MTKLFMATKNKNYIGIRYIPFKKHHVAPVEELTADAIKKAAKAAAKGRFKDREELKLTTAQNYIAKSLGFRGGFGGAQKAITDLNERYQLDKREILTSSKSGTQLLRISPRSLAERLFQDDAKEVTRVFTGHDIDWRELLSHFDQDVKAQVAKLNPTKERISQIKTLITSYSGNERWNIHSPLNQSISLLEADLATLGGAVPRGLIFHTNEKNVETFNPTYFINEASNEDKVDWCEYEHEITQLFRLWASKINSGWVTVERINENLILLLSDHGTYDFLVRRSRDSAFDHQIYGKNLKLSDAPKSDDNYHFRRWLYMEYDGWLEKDMHLSENYHYSKNGLPSNHPDEIEILKNWLTDQGKYHFEPEVAGHHEGFFLFEAGNKKLFVSNLVTIEDFRNFISDFPNEYLEYRNNEKGIKDLLEANSDTSELPVAVTWYDANAYASWLSKSKKLPIRLLEESEYSEIYQKLSAPQRFDGWHSDPIAPTEPVIYDWIEDTRGFQLATSSRFGEWLRKKGSAVNTAHLGSLVDPKASAYRYPFATSSTGEHKGMRIGFRLCYLAAE